MAHPIPSRGELHRMTPYDSIVEWRNGSGIRFASVSVRTCAALRVGRTSRLQEGQPVSIRLLVRKPHFLILGLFVWLSCASARSASIAHRGTALVELQAKADQAVRKDRCFLYAELMSRMMELAEQQFHTGDSRHGVESLESVRQYGDRIQAYLASDSKRLRPAEVLLRRASFQLEDMLREASFEDRADMEITLKQVNRVEHQIMMQVFRN